MALGEAETGEGFDLLVEALRIVVADAVLAHPREELRFQAVHALLPALRTHGAPQQVGVFARAVADGDGHLHELLLEDGHAQRALEHRDELRMRVVHRLLAVPASQIGVHRPALDRAGTDERDLDDEIVEAAGQQSRQGVELRAALHLEHADGVGAAQHVVDAGLFLGNGVEGPALASARLDDVHRLLQGAQHAEAEQVEFDEAHRLAAVLVPLQHRAPRHTGVLDGADLAYGALRQHHASRVDAEVARCPHELPGQLLHGAGIGLSGSSSMPLHRSRPLVQARCWPAL